MSRSFYFYSKWVEIKQLQNIINHISFSLFGQFTNIPFKSSSMNTNFNRFDFIQITMSDFTLSVVNMFLTIYFPILGNEISAWSKSLIHPHIKVQNNFQNLVFWKFWTSIWYQKVVIIAVVFAHGRCVFVCVWVGVCCPSLSKSQGRIVIPAAAHWDLAWGLQIHPRHYGQLKPDECLAVAAQRPQISFRQTRRKDGWQDGQNRSCILSSSLC